MRMACRTAHKDCVFSSICMRCVARRVRRGSEDPSESPDLAWNVVFCRQAHTAPIASQERLASSWSYEKSVISSARGGRAARACRAILPSITGRGDSRLPQTPRGEGSQVGTSNPHSRTLCEKKSNATTKSTGGHDSIHGCQMLVIYNVVLDLGHAVEAER